VKHCFACLPAIPYGRVTGRLTYAGQTHSVTGSGYHDHNWGNIGLNRALDHWYWGRAHVEDYTLIFVEQIATKAYGAQRLPVFMLAKGDKILIGDGLPLKMEARDWVTHAEGRRYPREVDFNWQTEAGRVHLKLRSPEMLEAVNLLHIPAWQRAILRLFVNPYYFRFNVNLELQVELGHLRETVNGSALYEIMLLK
jgi:predicted secreted hydrolase